MKFPWLLAYFRMLNDVDGKFKNIKDNVVSTLTKRSGIIGYSYVFVYEDLIICDVGTIFDYTTKVCFGKTL